MATVLFMDIVGYSLRTIDRQTEVLSLLQSVVKKSLRYQQANADRELITVPTGDGMALVFLRNPVSPVECALEIAGALRDHPEITLRMGIHTGPVCRHSDIKEEVNIVGGGINTAQRVMDCGDAGHILLSRAVAEVLEQFSGWSDCLRDLGIQEVKHSVRIHLYNLCKDGLGNPAVPRRLKADEPTSTISTPKSQTRWRSGWKWLLASLIAAVLAGVVYFVVQTKGLFPSKAAASKALPVESTASPSVAAIQPDAMRVVNNWADSMRTMDLEKHMAAYADSLETFYTKRDVPKADVAKEIQAMFAQYSSFGGFQLSKWSSRELPPDRLAIAFDKQYKAMYKTGLPNEGLVRSQLVLKRFQDGWKIIAESDTKVYWTNQRGGTAASSAPPQPEPAQSSAPAANPSLPLDVFSETATYRDPDSYVEFQYPSRVFHTVSVVDRNEVLRLKSSEGVLISVSIVPTDREDALRSAYRLELETPGRQISYKTGVRNGWYVVSGLDGGLLFYRRVVSVRGHIASLTVSHNKDLTPSFNPAVVVAQTFHAVEESR